MSIIDTLKDTFKRDINLNFSEEKAAPPQPLSTSFGFIDANEPPAKTSLQHLKSYRQISWIYKAVKKNAEKTSVIELRLMKHIADGEPEEVKDHESLEILASVNDFMTLQDLILMTQGYLELVGEAYWVKIKDGGTKEIWPLRPDKVEIVRDEDEFISGYIYKPRIDKEVRFEADEVIPFKEFDPLNQFRGMGAVMAAAYAGDTDLFASKWNRNFFFNSAVPLIAILFKDQVGQESIKRFKTMWNNEYQGVAKSHKAAVLKGVEQIVTDLQRSHKEMGFLDLRKFTRDEIIAIFGVPRTVMGITDDVNRANAEATTAAWLEHEIRPKMSKIANTLTEFYLREWNQTGELYFDFVDPVPANLEHELEVKKAQGIPWKTINEMRQEDGLEPLEIPEADRIYIPFNLTPIGEQVEPQQRSFKSGLGKVPFKKSRTKKKHEIMKVLKHHKKDFVKTMGSMMATPKGLTQDQKEEIWKQKIKITDVFEERFKENYNSVLNEQEELVLDRLRGNKSKTVIKQDVETITNLAEWVVRFEDELEPLIIQLIVTQGQRAIELTGQDVFDANTRRVTDFIDNEGLKFAKLTNDTTVSQLKDTLNEGIKQGEGTDELADRVKSVYQGIRDTRAENIARTEVSRAANFATLEAYQQDESIKKYEWLTALDERVCPWCMSMDGKIIEKGGTFFEQGDELTVDDQTLNFEEYSVKAPPLHPQCRCDTIPVIE